jgi:hypothetical protein
VEAVIITESLSPNGNVEAFVEQDDRCAYFYLREVGDLQVGFGVRSCWVRNLAPAPALLAVDEMRGGSAPMMPAGTCAHPGGARRLIGYQLRIVWLEEGDAAALLEGDSVLAIIPCWSGQGGFSGFARDCTGQSALAWPLVTGNSLLGRVHAAETYWRTWAEGNPWEHVQRSGLAAITSAFGPCSNYYAIDGGQWPPRAMVRCRHGDAVVLVTCGMQLQPQPAVELSAEDPAPLRRIELAIAIASSLFDRNPDRVMSWLSGQSVFPWRFHTWLGNHHTMPSNALPPSPGLVVDSMLLLYEPMGAPAVRFPDFRGDPVRLLWLVPITAGERELAEGAGSAALAKRLSDAGHGFVHRDRRPVV